MQSPPLELVLDVLHIGSRNLIRNAGDPDQDTISEITRGVVERMGPWGPLAFTGALFVGAEAFRRHILNPLGLPLLPPPHLLRHELDAALDNLDFTDLTGA